MVERTTAPRRFVPRGVSLGAVLADREGNAAGDSIVQHVRSVPASTLVVGSPVVVSWGSDRMDLFANASNGKTYHKYFSALAPRASPGFKGIPATRPGAVAWRPGPQSADWEELGPLPGSATALGLPAAVSWGQGRLYIFVLGNDGNVHHKFFNGAWGPGSRTAVWESLGGSGQSGTDVLNGGPTAVTPGPEKLNIVGTTRSAKAYHKHFNGPGWGGRSSATSHSLAARIAVVAAIGLGIRPIAAKRGRHRVLAA